MKCHKIQGVSVLPLAQSDILIETGKSRIESQSDDRSKVFHM